MSRMRLPLLIALLAALALPAFASASGSIIPRSGFYEGSDGWNKVRFFYNSAKKQLLDINIGGESFGNATVSGAQWHHTCYDGHLCTRGTWTAAHHISGIWNDSFQGGDVRFNAVWVSP